jgi:hypothetical protein
MEDHEFILSAFTSPVFALGKNQCAFPAQPGL